mmetsp:Transcript_22515/g.48496  ORF Transcript_22515/g.48496 Transcript_22515/m.48496 type:complete len:452 (+) Transcript_22515:339-1694(+)
MKGGSSFRDPLRIKASRSSKEPRLQQSLTGEVLVLRPIQHVPVRVLVLLLLVHVEPVPLQRLPQPSPQLLRVGDLRHAVEVPRVGYPQAPHPVRVPRFREVLLEVPPPPVRLVPADLAGVEVIQPVELEEPVGDGLPVPSQGDVLGVVDGGVVLVLLVAVVPSPSRPLVAVARVGVVRGGGAVDLLLELLVPLVLGLGGAALDAAPGALQGGPELVEEGGDDGFEAGDVHAAIGDGLRSVFGRPVSNDAARGGVRPPRAGPLPLLGENFGGQFVQRRVLRQEQAGGPVGHGAAALEAQARQLRLEIVAAHVPLELRRGRVLGEIDPRGAIRGPVAGRVRPVRGHGRLRRAALPAVDAAPLAPLLLERRDGLRDHLGRHVQEGRRAFQESGQVPFQFAQEAGVLATVAQLGRLRDRGAQSPREHRQEVQVGYHAGRRRCAVLFVVAVPFGCR